MKTTPARRPPARVSVPGTRDSRFLAGLLVLAVLFGIVAAVSSELARGIVGLLALVVVVVLAFDSRSLTIRLLIAWLVMLGFVRRALIPFAGWSDADPLLLVSPGAALLLIVTMRHEKLPARTLLGSLMTFQLLWILASAFNPNEPSVIGAAQSLLFFMTPVLWFHVGRKMTADEHDQVLRTVMWMGIPVVALGLYHTFVGLLPFELSWVGVANVHPAVLFVEGFHIRPFATLSSPQEYGMALGFVVLALLARLLSVGRSGLLYVALAVVAFALFLQGSRGTFLSTLFAAAIMWAVKRRSAALVLGALSFVFVAVFLASAGADIAVDTTAKPSQGDTSGALIKHQISGLTDPSQSTAGLHVEIYLQGLEQGLRNPTGLGPTKNKFEGTVEVEGEQQSFSPEGEFPITLIALGVPAGFALLAIYVTSVRYAFGLQRRIPSARHLVWLGLLIAGNDQMLNGRLYFTSALVGLVMGGMASEWAVMREAERNAAPPALARG